MILKEGETSCSWLWLNARDYVWFYGLCFWKFWLTRYQVTRSGLVLLFVFWAPMWLAVQGKHLFPTSSFYVFALYCMSLFYGMLSFWQFVAALFCWNHQSSYTLNLKCGTRPSLLILTQWYYPSGEHIVNSIWSHCLSLWLWLMWDHACSQNLRIIDPLCFQRRFPMQLTNSFLAMKFWIYLYLSALKEKK